MYLALGWVEERSIESMAIVCFPTEEFNPNPESSKIYR